jgi:porphobilinogen deaminase
MLLSGSVDLAIHSAKDLPDPIPNGLKILSITPCIDSRDCLVLREALRPGMCIATSSERREEIVKSLCPNLKFVDLRGTIEERLAKIGQEVDGIVVAEAALVRLKLNPNRIYLPGTTTPLQGCLAMLVRDE